MSAASDERSLDPSAARDRAHHSTCALSMLSSSDSDVSHATPTRVLGCWAR